MKSPDGQQMIGAKRKPGGSAAIDELAKLLRKQGGGDGTFGRSMALSKFK